jgi:hypothetical protein
MTIQYPITNGCGETVEPSGHIRERIGAALCAAKPSLLTREAHYERRLRDPMGYFLFTFKKKDRDYYEVEWADNLLVALDKLGLSIVETGESA